MIDYRQFKVPYLLEIAMRTLIFLTVVFGLTSFGMAQDLPSPTANLSIWPDLAPDETSREVGTKLPALKNVSPLITRLTNVRKPTLDVFPAAKPNGVGVLILPGGGFNFVVPDLEGSEAAVILNKVGITVFVLRYRTKRDKTDPGWKQALQDSQRTMKYIRANSKKWKLDENKLGLLGFSAGGQVAARLLTDGGKLAYEAVDEHDKLSHRPNFSILIYPWNMYVAETKSLLPEIVVTKAVPPTFIVHTHNDRSSSLGGALFYVGLKNAGVSAELHIYENGGHGYGVRARPNSNIGTWSNRMVDWLKKRQLATGE